MGCDAHLSSFGRRTMKDTMFSGMAITDTQQLSSKDVGLFEQLLISLRCRWIGYGQQPLIIQILVNE